MGRTVPLLLFSFFFSVSEPYPHEIKYVGNSALGSRTLHAKKSFNRVVLLVVNSKRFTLICADRGKLKRLRLSKR